MKLLQPIYDRCLRWAKHPKAVWLLGLVSFSESIFFPIPVAIMLIPMVLSRPNQAWRLALFTTMTSVAGGVAGYFLGLYAFGAVVQPFIESMGYTEKLVEVTTWFREYGVWIVLLAGFSPIPYKLFTTTAGALGVAFAPFVLASIVARAAQFYLIAGLLHWGGEAMEGKIRKHIDVIGWIVIVLAIGLYWFLH